MRYVKSWLATAVVFMVLDSIWLGLVTVQFYRDQVGHLMADQPNFYAAAIFYFLYLLGIVYFAVRPGANESDSTRTVKRAALDGALLGLFAYGTFDLTSYALLKDWPLLVVVVDMAWGAFITGVSAAAGRWAISSQRAH